LQFSDTAPARIPYVSGVSTGVTHIGTLIVLFRAAHGSPTLPRPPGVRKESVLNHLFEIKHLHAREGTSY